MLLKESPIVASLLDSKTNEKVNISNDVPFFSNDFFVLSDMLKLLFFPKLLCLPILFILFY